MNEPRRLVEAGNDDFERDLLRSAHGDQPSDRAFQRTLVSIGVGLAVTPAAVASAVPVTATLGTKLGSVVLAKWLFTGVALGVVTAGGVGLTGRVLERPPVAAQNVPARKVAPQRPAETSVARAPSEMPAAPATTLELSDPPPALVPAPARRPEHAVPPAPAPSPGAAVAEATLPASPPAGAPSGTVERLAHETTLLDVARGALLRGDAKRALATLREYERNFSHGMLAPEARVLEVRALLANGERTAAEALAARIVDAAPNGEHADTVRALLARPSNR
jgi:hypothetical protein